jgi:hypothetical protein
MAREELRPGPVAVGTLYAKRVGPPRRAYEAGVEAAHCRLGRETQIALFVDGAKFRCYARLERALRRTDTVLVRRGF